MWPATPADDDALHSGIAHVAFDHENSSAPAISSFRGSIPHPNSCVRFVFGVATASRNTRFQAARYGPWVGLAPADRASFAWRLPPLDHLVGTAKERQRNCDAEEFRGLEISG
jgi:hypothetical protein